MSFAGGALERATVSSKLVRSGRSLDLEIIDLAAGFPEVAKGLPAVFEECLVRSIKNLLPRREAGTVLRLLKGADLGNPDEVYSAIDRVFPRGASLLKGEIAAEFHGEVRSLFRQAMGSHVDSAELVKMSASLADRLGI